jgi:hypothetical protein
MPMSPSSPMPQFSMTFQVPAKTVTKLGKGVGKKAASKKGATSKTISLLCV